MNGACDALSDRRRQPRVDIFVDVCRDDRCQILRMHIYYILAATLARNNRCVCVGGAIVPALQERASQDFDELSDTGSAFVLVQSADLYAE